MKKLSLVTVAAVVALAAGSAWAGPSTKFTAMYGTTEVFVDASQSGGDGTTTDNTSVAHVATVKIAQKKDLLIGVSLQTGIDTKTLVRGKNGGGGTATATGWIGVVVTVGGQVAKPGLVVFDARTQELSATLGGVIEQCNINVDVTVDPETGVGSGSGVLDVSEDCLVSDEEISLLLSVRPGTLRVG